VSGTSGHALPIELLDPPVQKCGYLSGASGMISLELRLSVMSL
jgi:hypothetical protein